MRVLKLEVSNRRDKKYVADVIIDDKLYQNVHFGSRNYQHYRDMTPIKAFSHLDHTDIKRRENFHARHRNNNGPAAKLSKELLW